MAELTRGTLQNREAEYTPATLVIPNGTGVRFTGRLVAMERGDRADLVEIVDGPLAGALVAVKAPTIDIEVSPAA